PATGEEAWPARSIDEAGQTFGGRLVELAPDRKSGIMSWMDGDESMITRISFDDGKHMTIHITEAREIDDTGADYFTVYPTADPNRLTYVYGSADPDDPMSSTGTRAAKLTVPEGLEASDGVTLSAPGRRARASTEGSLDPVCAAAVRLCAAGTVGCLSVQLSASPVNSPRSDGAAAGWLAAAPEVAAEVLGYCG